MLNLFQKYRRSSDSSGRRTRETFKQFFFNQVDHAWINEHHLIRESFENLWERLPSALLTTLLHKSLSFIPSQRYQAMGQQPGQWHNTVVVFPEYQRLLARGNLEAVAFLAHEVALVLYALESGEERDELMAEVEADKFVCDLGLSLELEQLLLSMDESTEKRLRLTYLTFKALGLN